MRKSRRSHFLAATLFVLVLLMRILLDVPVVAGVSVVVLVVVLIGALSRLTSPKCPRCGTRPHSGDLSHTEYRGSQEGWHWESETARTDTTHYDRTNQPSGHSVSHTELPPIRVRHTDHVIAFVYVCPSCAHQFEVVNTARMNGSATSMGNVVALWLAARKSRTGYKP